MIYHVKHRHILIIWQAFASLQTAFTGLQTQLLCVLCLAFAARLQLNICLFASFVLRLQLVCSLTSVFFQYTTLILIGPPTCKLTNPEAQYTFWRLASCFESFDSILRQGFVQRASYFAEYWTNSLNQELYYVYFLHFLSTNKEQEYSMVYSDLKNG